MRRRPWIEAAALLGAAGHADAARAAASPPQPHSPLTWRLTMTDDVRFAFIERLDAVTKPRVFQSLDALAGWIEARRHGQAIQLIDVEDLRFQWRAAAGRPADPADHPGRTGPDRGVRIDALLLDGGTDRVMGFAWLDGRDRTALEPAIDRARRARGGQRQAA